MIEGGGSTLADSAGNLVQPFEEITDVDLEEAGDIPELRSRDPVGAFFIFLDLLEGETKSPPEVTLVVAQTDPFFADSPANMPIYRMGTILAAASRHR